MTGRATNRDDSLAAAEDRAQQMIEAINANQPLDGRVMVIWPTHSVHALRPVLVNELDRAGVDVRVDAVFEFLFGESRGATVDEVDDVVYVIHDGQYLSVLSGEPGADVLWQESPLGPDDEQELRELQRQVWTELVRAGRQDLFVVLDSPTLGQELAAVAGIDQAAVDRIEELNQLVVDSGKCRCAAIAFTAADAPDFALPS